MCAAAFVQNRKSYTGCTDAPNPSGESGRSWCYVEAQVSVGLNLGVGLWSCLHLCRVKLLEASASEAAWNFCAPVVDYNGLRKEVAAAFADKIVEVQGLVAKLQKTQRAAEQALDKRVPSHCVTARQAVSRNSGRYEKTCAS